MLSKRWGVALISLVAVRLIAGLVADEDERMDRHLAKGLAVGIPVVLLLSLVSADWSTGATLLSLAVVGALTGAVMMRSESTERRRRSERHAG